jgi:hypothetical protein
MITELKRTTEGSHTFSFFGDLVIYDCPNCKSSLKSCTADIDVEDKCPICHNTFIVPGHEVIAAAEKLREEKEAARKEKEEREHEALTVERHSFSDCNWEKAYSLGLATAWIVAFCFYKIFRLNLSLRGSRQVLKYSSCLLAITTGYGLDVETYAYLASRAVLHCIQGYPCEKTFTQKPPDVTIEVSKKVEVQQEEKFEVEAVQKEKSIESVPRKVLARYIGEPVVEPPIQIKKDYEGQWLRGDAVKHVCSRCKRAFNNGWYINYTTDGKDEGCNICSAKAWCSGTVIYPPPPPPKKDYRIFSLEISKIKAENKLAEATTEKQLEEARRSIQAIDVNLSLLEMSSETWNPKLVRIPK